MKPSPIQNEEHIQATQEEQNRINESFKETLSERDKKRFDAVSQCFKILKENDVAAFIFPVLKCPTGIAVYQYNNALDFIEYDSAGKFTEEAGQKLGAFNTLFTYSSFVYMKDMIIRDREFEWMDFADRLSDVISRTRMAEKVDFYKEKA